MQQAWHFPPALNGTHTHLLTCRLLSEFNLDFAHSVVAL